MRIQRSVLVACGSLLVFSACGARTDAGSGGTDAKTDATDAGSSSGALHFDGVNDILKLGAATGAASETAFSSELWFRRNPEPDVMPSSASKHVGSLMSGADRSA
jgi:hypothetical protein